MSEAVRLDVWLDVACLFKTRSEAQRACKLGKVAAVLAIVGILLHWLSLPPAAVCVVLRFRSSRGVERQQLRWVAAGATVAALAAHIGDAEQAAHGDIGGRSGGGGHVLHGHAEHGRFRPIDANGDLRPPFVAADVADGDLADLRVDALEGDHVLV